MEHDFFTGLWGEGQTFEWLEKDEDRSFSLAYNTVDPALDSLRSDPGFQDLLRRMNLQL